MENDKRKAKRFSINQLVEVSYEGEEFVRAEGVNLSEKGMMCTTVPKVSTMSPVFVILKLEFPDESAPVYVKTEGMIMHAEERDGMNYAGIEFTDMPEDQMTILKRYISTLE